MIMAMVLATFKSKTSIVWNPLTSRTAALVRSQLFFIPQISCYEFLAYSRKQIDSFLPTNCKLSMTVSASVHVMLKTFSLSDAAVSVSVSAGTCRRSVLCSLLLNGSDWGPSVWHGWWRIHLPFQEQHSGVSMTCRLLQPCFPWSTNTPS